MPPRPVRAAAWAAAAILALSGCDSAPEFYAPPEQIEPLPGFRPYRSSRIIEMGPPDAERYIVSGILGSSGEWRWTGRRPTVKLNVREQEDMTFIADFALADATFQDTGPVTVSFWVGDHKLDELYMDTPGERHFEAPVPAEWLTPDSEVLLAAEVDKVWVAPNDGVELGLILTRIGLQQVLPTETFGDESPGAGPDGSAL